jgi:hypothetical protein
MKTADLSGSLLDYWVSKAIGDRFDDCHTLRECNGYFLVQPAITQDDDGEPFAPSELWAHGGPIIERERIELHCISRNGKFVGEWMARMEPGRVAHAVLYVGATPLIAAMRIFVASRFGEEVPDEAAS